VVHSEGPRVIPLFVTAAGVTVGFDPDRIPDPSRATLAEIVAAAVPEGSLAVCTRGFLTLAEVSPGAEAPPTPGVEKT